MIDTIKLMLSKSMFIITDVRLFQKRTQNGAAGYFTLVQNPTASELKEGIYKPRLTVTKRFNTTGVFEATLSIELSLPKLLYRNNFDELEDKEFAQIIDLLQQVLKTMGVTVTKDVLESAPVVAIHYSKNVPLTDGSTPYQYIKKISQGNYALTMDTDKVNYRNDGQLFKLHTNSWELVVYDKLKELEIARKSDKRSMENDNIIQLNLFEDKTMRKPFEVLRLEARYNNRAKIRHILKIVGIDTEPTLKNLFSSTISQKVMLHFLTQLELARPASLDYKAQSEAELLPAIIVNNPKMPPRKQLMLYGLQLAMDKFDLRELRNLFGKRNDRNWSRLVTENQNVVLPKTVDIFATLRKHLKAFIPLKLIDYMEKEQ